MRSRVNAHKARPCRRYTIERDAEGVPSRMIWQGDDVTGAGMRRNGHKFNAVKTVIDGYTFASKAEAKRYGELKMLQKAGKITGLLLQPAYALLVTGNGTGNEPVGFTTRLGAYIADFTYFDKRTQMVIIEDVKSPATRTPIYRWKIKHLKAQYGVEVVEVYDRRR